MCMGFHWGLPRYENPRIGTTLLIIVVFHSKPDFPS